MKRIFKLTYAALVAVLAVAVSSCTKDYDYDAVSVSGQQVYFSNESPSTIELSATSSTYEIPIMRIDTTEAITVPLAVTIPDGANYTVPSEVSFAAGQKEASIAVTYDPNNIEYGKYDTLTIAINEAGYTTPYGLSSYTFAMGLSEWKSMSSKGTLRDGIMSYLYGFDEMTWGVEIQENVLTPGRYRVVSPYCSSNIFYQTATANGFSNAGFTTEQTSIVIDATDPDYVYIASPFYPGVDDGDGPIYIFSYVDYYLQKGYSLDVIKNAIPSAFGTLSDGVISFPENCLIANFTGDYTLKYYGNNDRLAIALPGYSITDYSSSFEYEGHYSTATGKDYAVGTITLGESVASAKYAVIKSTEDVNETVSGIIDGSVESTEVTASGQVQIALTEGGDYTVVIVTFDANGEAQSYSTSDFTFNLGTVTYDWQALYTGTFTFNAQPAFITDNDGEYAGGIYGGTQEATLYVDEGTGKYRIAPWGAGDGLIFTMASDGTISFDDVDTGETYGSYGAIYAADAATHEPDSFTSATSYYDGEQFVFGTLYYVTAGYLGGAYETFEITGTAEASKLKLKGAKARSHAKMRSGVKIEKVIRKEARPIKGL